MHHSAREPEPLRLPSVIFEVTCHVDLGVEHDMAHLKTVDRRIT